MSSTHTTYDDFLASKAIVDPSTGLSAVPKLNPQLFDFQRDIVRWALRKGRAAIFADCGLGKTPMQLEWAHHVATVKRGRVLILAPLAVAQQTVREGKKFNRPVHYARNQDQADQGDHSLVITNYEMLSKFDADAYVGVVLDESSILKSYSGKIRNEIIDTFARTPFRLACTATPAPNDYLELGNHSEFLGIMERFIMRSMFFVHDSQMFKYEGGQRGGDVRNYRLKKHAEDIFWEWVSSWSVMLRSPRDLGYEQAGFELPPLHYHEHVIETDTRVEGYLFSAIASTLHERIKARSDTAVERAERCASVVNGSAERWIVWCGLNTESKTASKLVDGAREVTGSDSIEHKQDTLNAFALGKIRVLVTKPSIAGFGMNFQACSNVAFLGLSDSWEQYYQAVRRCWRFGQKSAVDVHLITSNIEGKVVNNIKKKEARASIMLDKITEHMAKHTIKRLRDSGTRKGRDVYEQDLAEGDSWKLYLGDAVEAMQNLDDDSVDFSVFSPPFMSLFIYSDTARDVSNCANSEEFFEHLRLVFLELYRVMKPGRLVSVHTSDIPRTMNWDGYMGLRDLRGEIIRAMEALESDPKLNQFGFHNHSSVCIWKNPVSEMQRTKALGLLFKQLRKDSSKCRMATADYITTFRKPGDNAAPIEHTESDFPLEQWQRWASPIWTDIVQGDTLQKASARDHKDEKHACPLQLSVIKRCIALWSNPGDLVLSPFAGIGSEGYVALQNGRRFVGIELKRSYWKQARANLASAKNETMPLFAGVEPELELQPKPALKRRRKIKTSNSVRTLSVRKK